jgi:ABC-type Fe3+ transport system permease subunit
VNKYTAAVVLAVLGVIVVFALWYQDARGADALIDVIDRLSLVIMVIIGTIIAITIFFVALYFIVKFQHHDDRGEIERMRAQREHTSLLREDSRLAQAQARLEAQMMRQLPAPTRAQLPMWDDADDDTVDARSFVISP